MYVCVFSLDSEIFYYWQRYRGITVDGLDSSVDILSVILISIKTAGLEHVLLTLGRTTGAWLSLLEPNFIKVHWQDDIE